MKNSVWKTFMELSLVRGIVPRTVFGLTAIAAIILVIGLALSKSNKRGRLHPLIVSLIAAVLAGAAGMLVAWLVSDVFMVFGVSLGWPVIFTIAGGIAGVGFVIAAAVTMRGARRVLAIVLVPLVLLSTALGVDSIYGEYQTIGTLVGYTPYASLGSIEVHKAAMSVSDWRSKAQKGSLPSMPSQGKVLTVDIPNAKSNFTARKAMIYLPPAALSDRPPALPVMELLAGQPGSPSRLIDAGNIAATMNAYAAKHDGLAPIVLVPDQNGEATHNSLCADTTQGNAETYLHRRGELGQEDAARGQVGPHVGDGWVLARRHLHHAARPASSRNLRRDAAGGRRTQADQRQRRQDGPRVFRRRPQGIRRTGAGQRHRLQRHI